MRIYLSYQRYCDTGLEYSPAVCGFLIDWIPTLADLLTSQHQPRLLPGETLARLKINFTRKICLF